MALEDLARLEAGEQVRVIGSVDAWNWVQVEVDTAEYILQEAEAFFGPHLLLQKRPGGGA
jgi:hypothetical protein